MKSWSSTATALVLFAAGVCASLPAQAGLFSSVVAFGDSLSDTGNSGLMTVRPDVPQGPYADGRSTNGPVAAEVLASGLGVQLQSYAVGGAMTGVGNADVGSADPGYFSGMLRQVSQYLTNANNQADANALYLVFGGSNDFLHLLDVNPNAGDADIMATANEVITNLTDIVQLLYGAGARHFLLPLLPDLGAAPGVGDATVSGAIGLVNQALGQAYADLMAGIGDPDASFVVFDTFAAQQALTPQFAAGACLTGTDVCSNPDEHFFWDDLHPTAAVHTLIGEQFLAAVPEPAALALVMLALLAGGAARRRATRR